MSSSLALKEIFAAGRPLIEAQLDLADQVAALRDAATAKGLDWSQLKALMKAQIQDERDDAGDGRRVKRIVEKAEFASAYADMLGLANMNENNFSAASYSEAKGREAAAPKASVSKAYSVEMAETAAASFEPETGEITDNQESGCSYSEASISATASLASDEGEAPITHSQAIPSKPADTAGEVNPSSRASSATHSDDIDLTIPDFLRRTEGGYPKRESVEA